MQSKLKYDRKDTTVFLPYQDVHGHIFARINMISLAKVKVFKVSITCSRWPSVV